MEINEEDFGKYLQLFVTDVWNLLLHVSQNPGQVGLANVCMGWSLHALKLSALASDSLQWPQKKNGRVVHHPDTTPHIHVHI